MLFIDVAIMEKTGHQVQFVSWWPRPAAWNISSLNTGYWSRDAESWYQSRLLMIKNSQGPIELYRNSTWRDKIKFGKREGPRLMKRNDNIAEEYLLQSFKSEDQDVYSVLIN